MKNFDATNTLINEWNSANMGFNLSHNRFSVLDDKSFGQLAGLDLTDIESSQDVQSCKENGQNGV